MIFEHATYQDYLSAVLATRKAANRAYSLRAFARSLGVSQSTLSDVIKGKKQLSPVTADEIALRLKLPAKEKKYLRTLVQMQIEKDADLKSHLESKLRTMNPSRANVSPLAPLVFRLISEWHFTAILEMTHLHEFDLTPESIAASLSIPKTVARESLDLLVEMGLLKKMDEKRFKKTNSRLFSESEVPNEALRNYHRQMLVKAQDSLETQTPKEKFVGSETLPIATADLPQAFEILENCFQQLILLAEKSAPRNEVYHVGVQMFRLTKPVLK